PHPAAVAVNASPNATASMSWRRRLADNGENISPSIVSAPNSHRPPILGRASAGIMPANRIGRSAAAKADTAVVSERVREPPAGRGSGVVKLNAAVAPGALMVAL